MSTQLYVQMVDWEKFLAAFPEQGEWVVPCKTVLQWDDLTVNTEFGRVYEAVRDHLAPDAVAATDKLLAVVCVNGLSKRVDRSALYKPAKPYKKEDFQYDEVCVVPSASPEQVGEILAAFETLAPRKLIAEVTKVWPHADTNRFETPKQYVDYIRNWVKILKEIQTRGGGLAIDMC